MGAVTTNGDVSPHDQYANGTETMNGAHSIPSEDDDDNSQDESKAPSMVVNDQEFSQSMMKGLSKLRKNRQFCDVILQVSVVLLSIFVHVFMLVFLTKLI